MKINKITDELIQFHFGSLNREARQRVEEQLLTAPQFLHEYLVLKRDFETVEEEELSPSQHIQEKIKSDIFREVPLIDFSFLKEHFFTLPRLAAFASLILIFALFSWNKDAYLESSETLDLQSELKIDTSSENPITLNLL